jgi:hypothetical protein
MLAYRANNSFNITVLYSDSQGITHFRDEHLSWEKRGGGMVTPFLDASKIGFLRIPKGFKAGF